MKKANLLLGLLLTTALSLFAERVTPETARKVATTFMNNNGAKTAQLTDISKEAGFPNLYIFNADPGYVVMAADDCVKPILGYSLTGTFKWEDMPENISSWLQGYNDEIQDAIDRHLRASAEDAKLWNDLENGKDDAAKATPIVAEMLTTRWNQREPYNNLCPLVGSNRTVTGCVATAMAQVMKYWNHPAQGTGSYSYQWNSQTLSANFGETTYDWTHMNNTYSSSSTDTQKTAVATLMYHCGVSLEMNYGVSSSGASTNAVVDALQTYFGYSTDIQYKSKDDYETSEWIAMLKNELNEGRPLQYRGSDAGGEGGHSFVCDGYNSDDFFHFNWGWGGYCDGYYSVNNMNPNPGASATGAGNGIYTVGQGAIFGIEPNSTLTAPTLSASLDQNNVTLSWNAITGATSYEVYRNDAKIATTTETQYIDSNLISNTYYTYYVRTVSGSIKSNHSNHITKLVVVRDFTPADLSMTMTENNAALQWTAPSDNTLSLQYSTNSTSYCWGMGENRETYWAEVFDPSRLTALEGMYIQKVSVYLFLSGNYTLYIYQDNTTNASNKLAEQSISVSDEGWTDIVLGTPVPLDNTKKLWIVMYCPTSVCSAANFWYPAGIGMYDEIQYDNTEDPERYNPRWISGSLSSWSYVAENVSWLMRTYLSDGTYTYNLYDGKTKVNGAVPITGTSYNINSLANGAHQYTVKTNYYGGESEASNMVGITLGATEINDLNLDTDDVMTVTSGSSLTVNGTITNANPANLVIEDGAQLIHSGSAVNATLKKTINAYATAKDGWYTIASPVNELGVDLATTGEYDLYTYDEKNVLWLNQEKPANNITQFNEGQGFLYANASHQSLAFAGNMKATDVQVTVTLSCQSDHEYLKGFNLLGNPFTRNLVYGDITIGDEPLTTYYTVEGGYELEAHALADHPIKPGQGFLVQTTTDKQSLVFNPSSKNQTDAKPSFISIEVGDGNHTDRAYVQFDKGNTLHKMTLSDNTSTLSVWHDKARYASLTVNDLENELPLSFKASTNGEYTLTVTAPLNAQLSTLNFETLHLIDNLTGADIDLLETPSYTFEAKTTDYESRFKLVFGETMSNNILGNVSEFIDGETQILDMTGRVVATDRNTKLAPGVYILRTVNGNSITTKKIILNK